MPLFKKILISIFFMLTLSPLAFADNLSDSNKLFNWAEQSYTQFFRPSNQETFELSGYVVRFYSDTNIYLGVKGGRIYVYGDVFDGLKDVGALRDFMNLINNESHNPAGDVAGECATIDGLTWELKTNDGGLRDKEHEYVWYDPTLSSTYPTLDNLASPWSGVPDGTEWGTMAWQKIKGNCVGSKCDTYSYVQIINEQKLCGYDDWRVPSFSELKKLRPQTHLLPNLSFAPYWTSTTDSEYGHEAWTIDFVGSHTEKPESKKSWTLPVMLVR